MGGAVEEHLRRGGSQRFVRVLAEGWAKVAVADGVVEGLDRAEDLGMIEIDVFLQSCKINRRLFYLGTGQRYFLVYIN